MSIKFTRNLFLKSISLLYLISFISLYFQIQGLWGNEGILPAKDISEKIKYKLNLETNDQQINIITNKDINLNTNLNTKNSNSLLIRFFKYPCVLIYSKEIFNFFKNLNNEIFYYFISIINDIFNIEIFLLPNSSHGEEEILMFIFCLFGIFFSCLTFFNFSGFFNPISYFIIWFIYLNFNLIGQDFMSFEVDYLFIEIGFLAIFYCPWFNKGKLKENLKENLDENEELNETPIENMVYYYYRFLLFRYLLSNSYEKISSGNFLYQNMNYFSYYLQNQAFPSYASYYIYYNIDSIKKFIGAYFLINEVIFILLIY
jgi:hypothetical protein